MRIEVVAADSDIASAGVRRVAAAIRGERPVGLVSITPAYATVLLELEPGFRAARGWDESEIEGILRAVLDAAYEGAEAAAGPIVEIPVCYEEDCAADIAEVARLHNIDVGEVVRLHSAALYTVQFIGFVPGFAYLSGLPKALATPRLSSPRVRVPAGSVGIAADQSGIYPSATPGGWRLIGRTPLVMFDAARERPSLLLPGDRVRFVPIAGAEFEERVREATGR